MRRTGCQVSDQDRGAQQEHDPAKRHVRLPSRPQGAAGWHREDDSDRESERGGSRRGALQATITYPPVDVTIVPTAAEGLAGLVGGSKPAAPTEEEKKKEAEAGQKKKGFGLGSLAKPFGGGGGEKQSAQVPHPLALEASRQTATQGWFESGAGRDVR